MSPEYERIDCEVEFGGGRAEISYTPENDTYTFDVRGDIGTAYLKVTPRELLALSTAITTILARTTV